MQAAQSLGGMTFIKLPKMKGSMVNALALLGDGPLLISITDTMHCKYLSELQFFLKYPFGYMKDVPVKQDGRYEFKHVPLLSTVSYSAPGLERERYMLVIGKYEQWVDVIRFHHELEDDRISHSTFFGGTYVFAVAPDKPVEFNVLCP